MSSPDPHPSPEDLIPGDPESLDRLGAHLRECARNASSAAGDVEDLDGGGPAAPSSLRFGELMQTFPPQLRLIEQAFQDAAQAVLDHAETIRRGREAVARAIELHAADPMGRRRGDEMVRQAQTRLKGAIRAVADQLSALAERVPVVRAEVGGVLLIRSGAAVLRISMDRPLQDPDAFVRRTGHATADLRYGSARHIAFADGTAGTSWDGWVAAGRGRATGEAILGTGSQSDQSKPDQPNTDQPGSDPAALGVLGVAGRTRRRRTAMSLARLEPAALPSRRRSTATGVPARLGEGGTIWRTNLTRPPHAAALPRAVHGSSYGTEIMVGEPVLVRVRNVVRRRAAG